MKLPIRHSALTALTLGLSASLLASTALAAEPPAANPPADPPPAAPDKTEEQPTPPREGGARGEGRRGRGGQGRGEGRAPRGEGNDVPQTPEERRKAALAFHHEVVSGLTTEQDDKILEIIAQIRQEMSDVSSNPDLSREEKAAHSAKVHTDWYKYFLPVFTDEQRTEWVDYHIAQHQLIESPGGQLGELKPQERREDKRTRLLAGYEEVLEELNVKKKSEILAALAAEEEAIEAANGDAALIAKAHTDALVKIDAQLNPEQRKTWRKATEAKAKAAAAHNKEEKPATH